MNPIELVWTILFFAGLVQGLFLAGALLTGRERERGRGTLLAALTLLFAAIIGEELIDLTGLYAVWPHALLATFALPLAIGPLLLFYARRIPSPRQALRRTELLHFVPMAAVLVYLLPFYLLPGSEKLRVLDHGLGPVLGPLVALKGAHVLAYQTAAILVCRSLLRSALGTVRHHLVWYRRMLVATLVPVLTIHVLYFLPLLEPERLDSDRFGSLVLATVIYLFAWAAMRGPLATSHLRGTDGAEPGLAGDPRPKYRTSPLEEPEMRDRLDELHAYMRREEPFRDPELRLDTLAAGVGLSSHALSQIVNEIAGANFYSFVNDYRIAAVKQLMADPRQRHRKLLALALDAGFNSKTSFNRVFKESTGLTPSEYRRRSKREQAAEPRPAAATPTSASHA